MLEAIHSYPIISRLLLVCALLWAGSSGVYYELMKVSLQQLRNTSRIDEAFSASEFVRKAAKDLSRFFLICAHILWGGISSLVLLQHYVYLLPAWAERILSTGIHVPFMFLLCGRIILFVRKAVIKNEIYTGISDSDIKKSITIIVIYLDFCLLLIDWELALFVAAILLGKYIWYDCVFNTGGLKKIIVDLKTLSRGKEEPQNASILAALFGQQMLKILATGVCAILLQKIIIFIRMKLLASI